MVGGLGEHGTCPLRSAGSSLAHLCAWQQEAATEEAAASGPVVGGAAEAMDVVAEQAPPASSTTSAAQQPDGNDEEDDSVPRCHRCRGKAVADVPCMALLRCAGPTARGKSPSSPFSLDQGWLGTDNIDERL